MFTPPELQEIRRLLTKEKRIVITSHYNPDGDAIGSSLGMYHYLKNIGIEANVVVPNDFPKFLKWMPGTRDMIIAEYKKKQARDYINEADVLIIVDYNATHRSGNLMKTWIESSRSIKILIDHHQQPEDFDYVYSDISIPATCQMVYHFVEAMGEADALDALAVECLYTGIMTDTGGFRFRSTSAETHRVVAELIDRGADPARIAENTWDTNSLSKISLLSRVLGRIELTKENKVALLYLTRKDLEEIHFEKGDTDGFVNYGLSILGVKMSVFFMEDLYEDFIKISFRSKGGLDVNTFSRKFFNGGGHINAAGGRSRKNLQDTIRYFKEKIEPENF
ncbi:MAG: bifunctional oligoribonuclease/PAP phosphatase NrnA [Bergeyella sp.]|nr:bifunctional oligoribonuclease/PAP phosphatase NrnA [Bergeyella sp.]